MNERIKELADHAGFIASAPTLSPALEKFAELIILECAKIADTAEPFKTSDLILKRFDIEVKKQYSV